MDSIQPPSRRSAPRTNTGEIAVVGTMNPPGSPSMTTAPYVRRASIANEKSPQNLVSKDLEERLGLHEKKQPKIYVYSLLEKIIEVLDKKEPRAEAGVEHFLEKCPMMDDCIRWHFLLNTVAHEGDECSDSHTLFSKMIIKKRPYLAFANPFDKSNIQWKSHAENCKQKVHEKNKDARTPFHIAARYGHAQIIKSMIISGRQFYDKSNTPKGPATVSSDHPTQDEPKNTSFIEIIKSCDPESRSNETALLLAAKSENALQAVQELLQVPQIAYPSEDEASGDKTFNWALESGLFPLVAIFLGNPELAKVLIREETIVKAIANLRETIEKAGKAAKAMINTRKAKKDQPDVESWRFEIAKLMIGRAQNPKIFSLKVVEMLIQHGSLDIWNAKTDLVDFLDADLRSCLLPLAVVHRKHLFVELFVEKNPKAVEGKWTPTQGEALRYPLWYNNHDKNTEGSSSETDDKDSRTKIRRTILTKMIHVVSDIETLLDILDACDVRDLCFDMSRFSSTTYQFSEFVDSLTQQEQGQNLFSYEETLRYAEFPPLDMVKEQRETYVDSRCLQHQHQEIFTILKWLANQKGVRTIIKLKMLDRLINPHDDLRMADFVDQFNVEILDWRTLDLSISSLKPTTKQRIRELHLYSSGKRSVMNHWFSNEGIKSLPCLRLLDITIVEETCTQAQCNVLKKEMEDALQPLSTYYKNKSTVQKQTDLIFQYQVNVMPWYRTPVLADLDRLAERIAPKLSRWLKNLGTVIQHPPPGFKRTKVAILDNGILSIPPKAQNMAGKGSEEKKIAPQSQNPNGNLDRLNDSANVADQMDNKSLWSRIKEGRSFVEGESTISPWLFASNPHGTQMANMICAIDPFCELYVARVAEDAFGITPKRVQKAIAWARKRDVDIISMSFAIGEETEELAREVQRAADHGIVMTCSTHDEGSKTEKAFPAIWKGDKHNKSTVIVLAACDEYGKILSEVDEDSYDYLIHGKNVAVGAVPFLKSEDTITGSSVATALAAGLCSLILTCDRLANKGRTYQKGRSKDGRYEMVHKHLKEMQARDKSKFVLLDKFGRISELGKGGSGNPSARTVLHNSFEAPRSGG